jgi:hypothetical protein
MVLPPPNSRQLIEFTGGHRDGDSVAAAPPHAVGRLTASQLAAHHRTSSTATSSTASTVEISCYRCLARVPWDQQPLMQFDPSVRAYRPLVPPEHASPELIQRLMTQASIQCPISDEPYGEHYLPYAYGLYGPPVIVGFVGASRSGKTHLLSAMVQAIDADRFTAHDVHARPVDRTAHRRFMTDSVERLFVHGTALTSTAEGVIAFSDAFVVNESGGRPRVLALFDVAGEELTATQEVKQFLYLADALIFVADPESFDTSSGRVMGDPTFTAVMNALADIGRLESVRAVVVLNKSDLIRHDEPIALWLRRGEGIDDELSLQESEDVYAYLFRRSARMWTRPYRECHRATLHVASATGSAKRADTFVRGVTPQRVLGPLLSVMAMTGVITSPAAQRIGI